MSSNKSQCYVVHDGRRFYWKKKKNDQNCFNYNKLRIWIFWIGFDSFELHSCFSGLFGIAVGTRRSIQKGRRNANVELRLWRFLLVRFVISCRSPLKWATQNQTLGSEGYGRNGEKLESLNIITEYLKSFVNTREILTCNFRHLTKYILIIY